MVVVKPIRISDETHGCNCLQVLVRGIKMSPEGSCHHQPLEIAMECVIPSPTSRAIQVLSTPELVSIIVSYLKRYEAVSLSRTCRLMLEILLPTTWRHVNGVRDLLRLINLPSAYNSMQPGNPYEIVCARVGVMHTLLNMLVLFLY